MYINPILVGIIGTLLVEATILILYAIGKDNDDENNKNSGNK